MYRIDIQEFVRSGEFGPIRLGMSRSDVSDRLGAPDDEHDFAAHAGAFLYGRYQCLFVDDRLVAVSNNALNRHNRHTAAFSNSYFFVDPWFLTGEFGDTIEELQILFKAFRLQAKKIDYYGRPALKMRCGVLIDFDVEGARGFNYIGYFDFG